MRLIDADALRKKAQLRGHVFEKAMVTAYHMCVSTHDIDDAPTVDAEPVRHGRWLEDYETFVQDNGYESKPIHTGFVCSVCGRHSSSIEPYCHCGAKMEGFCESGVRGNEDLGTS